MDQRVFFVILCVVLVIAAVCDWKWGKVFNWLTFPAMALGLVLHTIGEGKSGAAMSMGGLAMGYIPFLILNKMGGIGGGDAKLMGAIGAISASWRFVLAAILYSLLVGAVMAVVVMIRRGLVRVTVQRIYLAAVSSFGGGKSPASYDGQRIPYALALCIGGMIAGVEHMLGQPMPWSSFLH